MDKHILVSTARDMVAEGKGILAADESSGTIKRRLDSINVPSTEENRRAYRELLFTTPGVEAFISGIILYDETMRQQAQDGSAFPALLEQRGIIPGIKVDKGTIALPGFPGETITEGLDGLRDRLAEYRTLGARFTKWRAVITIGDGIPTSFCLQANAHALARYAALSQEAGLVPIVEPEVLMDGETLSHAVKKSRQRRCRKFHAAPRPSRAPRRHGAQAQHGRARERLCAASERGRSGRGDRALFPPGDPGGGTWDRVSLGWPERQTGHGASQCHECHG